MEQQFSCPDLTGESDFAVLFASDNATTSSPQVAEKKSGGQDSVSKSEIPFQDVKEEVIFKRPVTGTMADIQNSTNTNNPLPYFKMYLEQYNNQAIDTTITSSTPEVGSDTPTRIARKLNLKSDYKELSLLIATEELKSVIPSTKMFSKICRQRVLQEGTI